MTRSLFIFIAMFLLSVNIQAQSKKENEIAALVDAFNDAIIRIDSTTLKNMVSDELSYGHSSGLIQDKAAFIKGVINGPNFFKKFDLVNKTVKVAGKNAIVRHVATAQAINNGAPREIKFGNILIWKKEKGKWRLLARQGYTVM